MAGFKLRVLVVIFLLSMLTSGCDDDSTSNNTNNLNNTNNVNNTNNTNNTNNVNNTNNTNNVNQDKTANHGVISEFEYLPVSIVEDIIASFHIFYGHTSHGSQVVTGMNMLQDSTYDFASIDLVEVSDDLGHNGDLSWVDVTRDHLDNNPQTNIVIWSWCGGVSDNDVDGIQAYLDAMAELEQDYPDVVFVYMTGHTDGSGEDGLLRTNNRQIRDYCQNNDKYLFDFEDIESWDPAGNYYPDISDDCAWCTTWCQENTCPTCDSCAHSHCFNCYLKGKAMWWLLVQIFQNEGI